MEDKKKQEKKNGFEAVVTVGIVGHCPIEKLPELKHAIEAVSDFDLVFFKTSSGRLWIKDGDNGD